MRDVSLVLYDVTTVYFEADKEDTLRSVFGTGGFGTPLTTRARTALVRRR